MPRRSPAEAVSRRESPSDMPTLSPLPAHVADPAPLARLDQGVRAAMVAGIQRSHGNRYVQEIARQAALAREPNPDQPVFDPSKPTVAELETMAEMWIGQYWDAAHVGIDDFESVMAAQFDYSATLTALTGNLIWAAACFATGSSAFVISLAGIGVGTAAPIYSGKVDAAAFRRSMSKTIDDVAKYLKRQIRRVAVDSYLDAESEGEVGARLLMLRRLLQPEYIDEGDLMGMPTVDQPAIAHHVARELLVTANTYESGLRHPFGGGRFLYDYVIGEYESPGDPMAGGSLKPVSHWRIMRVGTRAYIPQGEGGALEELKEDAVVSPASIGWAKTITLRDERFSGEGFDIHFDGANTFAGIARTGRFLRLDPGEREAQDVVARLWSRSGGLPPDVPGAQLELATNIPLPLHEIVW